MTEATVSQFSKFTSLSESDVKLLISRSSLKTCHLDPAPSKLFAQCDALLPVITRIINLSLQSGCFPLSWKEALVHPLLKKIGLEATFMSFRPVSNLPFISKLAERACCIRTDTYSYGRQRLVSICEVIVSKE